MISVLKQRVFDFISDEKFSEIFFGSAWALLAMVFSTILGLVSSIIIAKFYGAEAVGIVAVTNSFLLFGTIFTVLGTNISILRFIPEHLTKFSPTSAFNVYHKTLVLVVSVSLAMSIVFFFGAGFIADKVFSKAYLSTYFSLAAIFVVFKSLTELNTQAIRGICLIRTFALMQILPQGGNLILLLLLGQLIGITNSVPVYALLGSFTLSGLAGWLIIEYTFRKRIQPQDTVHHMSIREIFSISLPMLMTATMSFVIGQTGIIMLGVYRSEAEVGYYAIAVKLASLTTFILSAINSISAPKFSQLFHSGKIDELFYVAKKSTKMIFWMTLPILLGFVVFGKPVLNIFFGQDFVAAYSALLLLVLGQFVSSISGSTGLFMNMTGRQVVFRNIMFVAAFTNIGLNFLLIPRFGGDGAAIAALVSLTIWNVTTLIYMKVKYGKTTGYFPKLFCMR